MGTFSDECCLQFDLSDHRDAGIRLFAVYSMFV